MSGDPQDYRPRSPDLSAYSPQPSRLINPTAQPQPYLPPQHRGSYDASPYFSPQTATTPAQSYFGDFLHQTPPQPQQQQQQQAFPYPPPQSFHAPVQPYQSQAPVQTNFQYPMYQQPQAHPYLAQAQEMPRRRKSEEMDEYLPEGAGGTRSIKHGKPAGLNTAHASNGGPSQGIEVKTKFPVARIKRIMQADEDVGKVAQATPTAVSKALELFMITLVTKASNEAKERSSKRITAQHLKAAVAKDEVLDFLNDIIDKVPDAAEGRGKNRTKTESPEPEEGKRKRGPRRKKSEAED